MKKLIYVFFFLTATFAFSQTNSEKIYTEVEQMAEFPHGGIPQFRKLIANNFNINKVSGKGKINCEITFVIERDGSLVDVKASGNNQSFNQEAVAAISKIKTKWIPAKLNNQPVRYRHRVPLNIVF